MSPSYLASHIVSDEAIDMLEMLSICTTTSLQHSRSLHLLRMHVLPSTLRYSDRHEFLRAIFPNERLAGKKHKRVLAQGCSR